MKKNTLLFRDFVKTFEKLILNYLLHNLRQQSLLEQAFSVIFMQGICFLTLSLELEGYSIRVSSNRSSSCAIIFVLKAIRNSETLIDDMVQILLQVQVQILSKNICLCMSYKLAKFGLSLTSIS